MLGIPSIGILSVVIQLLRIQYVVIQLLWIHYVVKQSVGIVSVGIQ